MIDINVPFASLGGNNIIYAAIGIGGFLFTTVGSLMIRCLLKRRKDKKNLRKQHEDIRNATEKVVQDVVKTYNLASIEEGIPVNRVDQKDIEAAREATRDAREAREATREAREATREALEARKACESRVVKMLREEDRVMIIRAEPV